MRRSGRGVVVVVPAVLAVLVAIAVRADARKFGEGEVAGLGEFPDADGTTARTSGGYERMLDKHRRLGITDEQRFKFASLMSLAADDAGMPDDPEFRSALVAYLEWGTRIALANSQADANVVAHAPVPRWGWGEAPPYRP